MEFCCPRTLLLFSGKNVNDLQAGLSLSSEQSRASAPSPLQQEPASPARPILHTCSGSCSPPSLEPSAMTDHLCALQLCPFRRESRACYCLTPSSSLPAAEGLCSSLGLGRAPRHQGLPARWLPSAAALSPPSAGALSSTRPLSSKGFLGFWALLLLVFLSLFSYPLVCAIRPSGFDWQSSPCFLKRASLFSAPQATLFRCDSATLPLQQDRSQWR